MPIQKKIGFWAVLFFALLVSLFIFRKVFSSVEVKTMPAKRQTLMLTVTATSTGTIKSDKEARITAQRQGRVSRLLVEEGEAVKTGSLVSELDSEEAYINLKMSQASLKRAEAGLEGLKTAFEPFRADVDANIQKAKAALKEAENRFKRSDELLKKGYISKMEFDSAERDYETAKANHEAAMAALEQLGAKAEEIKAQEAFVEESKSSLSISRLNYEYSFIKAPFDGVLLSRPVKLGETMQKGGLIATLVSMDSLYVESFIDEADVDSVRVGQEVVVTMDAYPERRFQGRVYMISPVVLGGKQEARTFEVRTSLKNTGVVLKPGMSADVEIVVKSLDNALVVPSQAVMEKEGRHYLFVRKGSRAQYLNVKTGASNWTYTEVVSGLKEGDVVIITPDVPGLKDGSRVKD